MFAAVLSQKGRACFMQGLLQMSFYYVKSKKVGCNVILTRLEYHTTADK